MSRPELDALLNALLPFAHQMLAKHGEFCPFAAAMNLDGQVTLVGSYEGDEHPASQAVLEALHAGLREMARKATIRAAGVCFDVRVLLPGTTEKTDAIQVDLEYLDGEAISVYQPYRKGIFGRRKYGELVATPGTRRLSPR